MQQLEGGFQAGDAGGADQFQGAQGVADDAGGIAVVQSAPVLRQGGGEELGPLALFGPALVADRSPREGRRQCVAGLVQLRRLLQPVPAAGDGIDESLPGVWVALMPEDDAQHECCLISSLRHVQGEGLLAVATRLGQFANLQVGFA